MPAVDSDGRPVIVIPITTLARWPVICTSARDAMEIIGRRSNSDLTRIFYEMGQTWAAYLQSCTPSNFYQGFVDYTNGIRGE